MAPGTLCRDTHGNLSLWFGVQAGMVPGSVVLARPRASVHKARLDSAQAGWTPAERGAGSHTPECGRPWHPGAGGGKAARLCQAGSRS